MIKESSSDSVSLKSDIVIHVKCLVINGHDESRTLCGLGDDHPILRVTSSDFADPSY